MASTRTKLLQAFDQRYQQLNEQQRAAVDATEGVVMVLAGPGTGKTELLAMRVANIVRQSQMDPWNILCLTFTESGVAALRRRLIQIMGAAAYQVRVHTFHSFCHRVIQDNLEYFAWTKELEAVTELEQIEIYQELLRALPGTSKLKPFGNWQLFLPDIKQAVSQLKQEGITPDEFEAHVQELAALVTAVEPGMADFFALKPSDRTPEAITEFVEQFMANQQGYQHLSYYFTYLKHLQADWEERAAEVEGGRPNSALRTKFKNDVKRWFDSLQKNLARQQELIEVYRAYQAELTKRGRYDYEDMISLVTTELKHNDQLLASLQEQFQYVLVDEYQDTNGAQNELLFTLVEYADEPNVFVVGDDKQSIYRFQGASLANLLSFYQRYSDQVSVIALEENYRSTQKILDAATALISHNQESVEQHLAGTQRTLRAAARSKAQPLTVVSYGSVAAEEAGLTTQLQQLLVGGTPASEIAVLLRKNSDVRRFADALRRRGVPVATQADGNVLEHPAVQQFVTLLDYLVTAQDQLLWHLLYFPWLTLDALAVLQAQTAARAGRRPLLAALGHHQELQAFATTLATWRQQSASQTVPDSIAQLLTDSGFMAYFAQAHDAEAIAAAQRLFEESKQLARRDSSLSLDGFLRHLRLLAEHGLSLAAAASPPAEQAVHVMTAHKAKGLEFEQVFIPLAVDRLWGNLRTRSGMRLPHGLLQHETVTLDPNEDERRLFYVALTRAKQQLTLSYAAATGDGRPVSPSEFIAEVPMELTDRVAVDAAPPQLVEQAHSARSSLHISQEFRQHLAGQLTNYVMSVTHLNNYLRCPRLFYFRNVLRVPAIKTKHMAFGTAVHAALRDLLEAERLSKKQLLTQFDQHLKKEFLTEHDHADAHDLGHDVLGRYVDHYKKAWQRNVLLEYDFAAHGVTVEGVRITGLLDKVEILDEKTKEANVVDYKTGQPDGKSKELKSGGEYHRQLVFYKLLCDHAPRFEYQMVSGEIDFIQPSRAGKFVKKKLTINDDDTQQLAEQIKDVATKIHNLEFLNEKDSCGECEYCQLN